jgi:hypothetical protein
MGFYDTIDSMPRFYALIKKVFKPGFLLRIKRLEFLIQQMEVQLHRLKNYHLDVASSDGVPLR